MTKRINRVIELFEDDQPVYYTGLHSFDRDYLTYEQGKKDASIWADYINIGMEHGAFDMGGLEAYMDGLVDGGPTPSGHVTPTVIVELPVQGESADIIRYNAWQIRQILARGVHGILLCEATTPDAVAAFVESCRYKINEIGVGFGLKDGTRGVGSEFKAKEKFILSITENGYGKRTSHYDFRSTNRGGKGIIGIVNSPRNGNVSSSFPVNEGDEILISTNSGRVIRVAVKEIRIAGRNTQGLRIIKLPGDEKVVSAIKIDDNLI